MSDPSEVPHMTAKEQAAWPEPNWREALHELREHLDHRLDRMEESISNRLREMEAMAQTDIDALVASVNAQKDAVNTLAATLTDDDGAIQAAIAQMEQQIANGQPVDLTALQAAVSDAGNAVSAMSAAVDNTTALIPPATS